MSQLVIIFPRVHLPVPAYRPLSSRRLSRTVKPHRTHFNAPLVPLLPPPPCSRQLPSELDEDDVSDASTGQDLIGSGIPCASFFFFLLLILRVLFSATSHPHARNLSGPATTSVAYT